MQGQRLCKNRFGVKTFLFKNRVCVKTVRAKTVLHKGLFLKVLAAAKLALCHALAGARVRKNVSTPIQNPAFCWVLLCVSSLWDSCKKTAKTLQKTQENPCQNPWKTLGVDMFLRILPPKNTWCRKLKKDLKEEENEEEEEEEEEKQE